MNCRIREAGSEDLGGVLTVYKDAGLDVHNSLTVDDAHDPHKNCPPAIY